MSKARNGRFDKAIARKGIRWWRLLPVPVLVFALAAFASGALAANITDNTADVTARVPANSVGATARGPQAQVLGRYGLAPREYRGTVVAAAPLAGAWAELVDPTGTYCNGCTVDVGANPQTFILELWINGGPADLTAQQSYLTFTNSILNVVNVANLSACQLTTSITRDPVGFDTELQNQTCNYGPECTGQITPQGGLIAYAAGAFANPPQAAPFRVAEIGLCAVDNGTAQLNWQFSDGTPPQGCPGGIAPANRNSRITSQEEGVVSDCTKFVNYSITFENVPPGGPPATFTRTATRTATNTRTPTRTRTATPGGASATNTPTATNTAAQATNTSTSTNTPVNTATNTPVNTATNTPTNTPTGTSTNTWTSTPTNTNTPVIQPTNTDTPVNTATNTPVNTATNTPVNTSTSTPVNTATNTPVNTSTSTPGEATNTNTPVNTATNTPEEATNTNTPVNTSTNTPGEATNTNTPVNTATNTPVEATNTNTPVNTSTSTPGEATNTNTPVNTATNTPEEATNTNTPVNTATNTPENTATDTPVNTATNTPEPPTATDTPENTATGTPVPATNTNTPTRTRTDTPVPGTATDTPEVPPTRTRTFTKTPTSTKTPTFTRTPTDTRTATGTRTATRTRTATKTPTPCGLCDLNVEYAGLRCNLDGTVHFAGVVFNDSECTAPTTATWKAELIVKPAHGSAIVVRTQTGTGAFLPGDTIIEGDFCYQFAPDDKSMKVKFTINPDNTHCDNSKTSHELEPCVLIDPCPTGE